MIYKLQRFCAGTLLAAACTLAQAQSQVTVYGIAAVEAVHATGVNTGSGIVNQNRLDNSQVTSSRLGFKGLEDLGDGLGAIFGLEAGIGLDTGTVGSAFWSRGSYVGLTKKAWGTLTFGRQWNTNDDIMANYFVFDGYSVFRYTEFDYISELVNNAVKYVSPEISGFQLHALAAPGEGTGGRTWEAALNYKLGGLNLGASSRYAKGVNGRADRLQAYGVSYIIGNFRPHAGWSSSDSKASGFLKAHAYDLGLQWAAMPLLTMDFDYTAKDQLDTDNDAHFWRVQAAYSLSKRTSFIANIVALKNKGTSSEHFYGSGAAGRDQNVFSLGMRHSF